MIMNIADNYVTSNEVRSLLFSRSEVRGPKCEVILRLEK
jgi:hypothetical protein